MPVGGATRLVAVLAVAENGVIGRDNGLPWRLSGDLRRFRSLTLGKPVLMGRRTFESLAGPLPGRQNIVITGDPHWVAPGCQVVHSLAEALAAAGSAPELMVIGGAAIYALCWDRLERIELTRVHASPDGDTVLQGLDWNGWQVESEQRHAADDRNEHDYSFVSLVRPALQGPRSASTQRQQSS
jgi:dihydrofolate reductase